MGSSRRRAAIGAAAGMLLAAGVLGLVWHHQRTHEAVPPPAQRPADREPRIVARVGAVPITNGQLERYQAMKQLWAGVTGARQALDELCNRTLLVLAASEDGIQLSEAEIRQEVFRKKVIIGAVASATPQMTPGAGPKPSQIGKPVGSGSPLDRVPDILAEAGLTEADLVEEAKAEALATRVRQKLVYDTVDIPRDELLAAAGAAPSEDSLGPIRERLRRERAAPKLAALLAQLGEKWKVQITSPAQR